MKLQPTSLRPATISKTATRLTMALLVVYLVVLCWILLFKLGVRFTYMEHRTVNLVPYDRLVKAPGRVDLSELILNVVVFIPLGIYAGMLFQRWRLATKLLFFFLVSLAIESLQYLLAVGAFDATDIANNTLGGAIGLVLLWATEGIFRNPNKAHRFLNFVATAATALLILLLLLLKMNMLPVRYQ